MSRAGSSQDSIVLVQPPAHPVPQLQGPFEESMLESVYDASDQDVPLDPVERRNQLLELPYYTRVIAGRWKQKDGEKYHPLWKLIAQISFGVHLLEMNSARNEEEVMQILQLHVDEIDGFLERTTEDFDLASEDIQERLRCLKLPLSHPGVFDRMLEDRAFRNSIVDGNEKIEHIIVRTKSAMKDALKDVQKGFDSTTCLEKYLQGLKYTWYRTTAEHEAVFVAMLGNVEGWRKAFMDLHQHGNQLAGSLRKLTDIINEMQQRAGEVSRKLLKQAQVYNHGQDLRLRTPQQYRNGSPKHSSSSSRQSNRGPDKGLPNAPRTQTHQTSSSRQSSKSGTQSLRPVVAQRSLENTSRLDSPQPFSQLLSAQTWTDRKPMRPTIAARNSRVVEIGGEPNIMVEQVSPTITISRNNHPVELETDVKTITKDPDTLIELPAHVPIEKFRQAPTSSRNRLSLKLGIPPRNKNIPFTASVTGSHPPPTGLAGLLKQSQSPLDPSTHALKPGTAEQSWLASPTPEVKASEFGVQSNSTAEKPLALISSLRGNSPQIQAATITPASFKTLTDQAYEIPPSTPSWASPTLKQLGRDRTELKKGAFNSHPPTLPPGSPPTASQGFQPSAFRPTLSTRTPSNNSSIATLGEPGPEITAASPASSSKSHPQMSTPPSSQPSDPASVERQPLKTFIAEMEGDIPVVLKPTIYLEQGVVELEAPRRFFQLPPRPVKTEVDVLKPPNPVVNEPPPISAPDDLTSNVQAKIMRIELQSKDLPPKPQRLPPPVPGKVLAGLGITTMSSQISVPAPNVGLDKDDVQMSSPHMKSGKEKATDLDVGPTQALAKQTGNLEPDDQPQTVVRQLVHQSSTARLNAVSSLLDQLAYTPPGSPMHNHSLSAQSANSALLFAEEYQQQPSQQSSQPLSTPLEVSSPASVGDQITSSPTISITADSNGEGKAAGEGSKSSWRAFFQGQPSPLGSGLSVHSVRRESTESASSVGSMMTSGGKDVLWFNKNDGGAMRLNSPRSFTEHDTIEELPEDEEDDEEFASASSQPQR